MSLLKNFFRQSEEPQQEERAGSPGNWDHIEDQPGGILGIQNLMSGYMNDDLKAISVLQCLSIPAVWAAVNQLSSALASLPLELFVNSTGTKPERVKNRLNYLIGSAPNPDFTSFDWRKAMWDSVLTHGRAYTYIERGPGNRVTGMYLLNYESVRVDVIDNRPIYEYTPNQHEQTVPVNQQTIYSSDEIIDLVWMHQPGFTINHLSPLLTQRLLMLLGYKVNEYGARQFANGGVPLYMVKGPYTTPGAISTAARDVMRMVNKVAKSGSWMLPMPMDHDVVKLIQSPNEMQMLETQKWVVEQVARIWGLPPIFLQDLTKGTFANTEQSDLHFAKHTLRKWIIQFEQKLNLRVFGWKQSPNYFKHDIDGLLRGDFTSRMTGSATAVQNAIRTPNEAREQLDLPPVEGGDSLFIQSGTVPIENQLIEEEEDDNKQQPFEPPPDDEPKGDPDGQT